MIRCTGVAESTGERPRRCAAFAWGRARYVPMRGGNAWFLHGPMCRSCWERAVGADLRGAVLVAQDPFAPRWLLHDLVETALQDTTPAGMMVLRGVAARGRDQLPRRDVRLLDAVDDHDVRRRLVAGGPTRVLDAARYLPVRPPRQGARTIAVLGIAGALATVGWWAVRRAPAAAAPATSTGSPSSAPAIQVGGPPVTLVAPDATVSVVPAVPTSIGADVVSARPGPGSAPATTTVPAVSAVGSTVTSVASPPSTPPPSTPGTPAPTPRPTTTRPTSTRPATTPAPPSSVTTSTGEPPAPSTVTTTPATTAATAPDTTTPAAPIPVTAPPASAPRTISKSFDLTCAGPTTLIATASVLGGAALPITVSISGHGTSSGTGSAGITASVEAGTWSITGTGPANPGLQLAYEDLNGACS